VRVVVRIAARLGLVCVVRGLGLRAVWLGGAEPEFVGLMDVCKLVLQQTQPGGSGTYVAGCDEREGQHCCINWVMARLWLRLEGYSCTQAMYRPGSERNQIIELESVQGTESKREVVDGGRTAAERD
jgi:hypothetical protein